MDPGRTLWEATYPPYNLQDVVQFSYSLTWDPMEVKFQDATSLPVFGDLPKIKNFKAFEFFINTGPYGAGNFKLLLLSYVVLV